VVAGAAADRLYLPIPVAVFYTKELRYLAGAMRAARSGETPQQAWDRFMGDWRALQLSPFFPVRASATVDEILSALHERIVVGSLA
jgi:hypothetical protein